MPPELSTYKMHWRLEGGFAIIVERLAIALAECLRLAVCLQPRLLRATMILLSLASTVVLLSRTDSLHFAGDPFGSESVAILPVLVTETRRVEQIQRNEFQQQPSCSRAQVPGRGIYRAAGQWLRFGYVRFVSRSRNNFIDME